MMNKAISFSLLLPLFSSLALASKQNLDAELFGDGYTIYIDYSSFAVVSEHTRSLTSILSYDKPRHMLDTEGVRSIEAKLEYDCKSGLVRSIGMSVFDGPMASETRLHEMHEVLDWRAPDKGEDRILRRACSLKPWKLIDETKKLQYYVLAEQARKGKPLILPTLMNFFEGHGFVDDGVSYRSFTSDLEINCQKMQTRRLAVSAFTGPMATGNQLEGSSEPSNWESVIPKSILESAWKSVCK